MPLRKLWIIGGLVLAVAVLCALPLFYTSLAQILHKPSRYRFPFPAKRDLTEQDALALSKDALKRDGKRSDHMRPVASGHKDSEGTEIFFCRRQGRADEGWVLWWVEKPDYKWEYMVGISRDGDEVVCDIFTPW